MSAPVIIWACAALGFTLVTLVRLGKRRNDSAGAAVRPEPVEGAHPRYSGVEGTSVRPEPVEGAHPRSSGYVNQAQVNRDAFRPDAQRIVLIRPLDAPGAHELEALRAPLSVRQIIASPERPDVPLEWVRSSPTTANRKVGHVLNALEHLGLEGDAIVLCIDADVRVDDALVSSLVRAIEAGAVAAFASPAPVFAANLAARCVQGVLSQSHHSFVALDAMSVGAQAMCGKAIALSALALKEWRTLTDVVGEDLELAKLLHADRHPVVLVEAAAQVLQSPSLRVADVAARFTRWMQVLRAHRAALFPTVPLFFAPTPMLVGLALLDGGWLAGSAVGALVISRFALAVRLSGTPRWEWMLAELMLLWCWLRSLFAGRTVTWRGRRYRLGAHGQMTHLEAGPA